MSVSCAKFTSLIIPFNSFSETPVTKSACFSFILVALTRPSASLKPDTSTIFPAASSLRLEKPNKVVSLSVLRDCPKTSIVVSSELIWVTAPSIISTNETSTALPPVPFLSKEPLIMMYSPRLNSDCPCEGFPSRVKVALSTSKRTPLT